MSGPSVESGGELQPVQPSGGIVAFIQARLDGRLRADELAAASTGVGRSEWESWDWVQWDRVWVEALRRIVDEHPDVPGARTEDGRQACAGCGLGNDGEYIYALDECPTKRLLASIWRSHPAWDPAWAPEEART